jgi:hypothetical protein
MVFYTTAFLVVLVYIYSNAAVYCVSLFLFFDFQFQECLNLNFILYLLNNSVR